MRFARIAMLVLGMAAALALGARAQQQPAPRPQRASASSAAPDWDGAWMPDFAALMKKQADPVFTPDYAAKRVEWRAKAAAGQPVPNPMQNCLPPGMPDTMELPFPVMFLFTRGRVTIIQEAFTQVRTVFMDGRGHPSDADPTYNGHSIGHWEGDTLVIDTAQLRADTYLPMRGETDFVPGPHSDVLHIVERIRLADPDRLEDHLIVTDDKALAQPWEFSIFYTRHRDWDLHEYVCEENNRDQTDASGHDMLKGVQK